MDVANQVADAINKGFEYLRTNAWPILFLIGVFYIVKTKVLDVYFTGAPSNTPNRVRSLEEDMRRVRLAQQAEAQTIAKKAAKENKAKEREKKHKKNVSASASSLKKDQGGDTMGYSTGYNPLNPSSGATCGFRPGRKGPTRGGG